MLNKTSDFKVSAGTHFLQTVFAFTGLTSSIHLSNYFFRNADFSILIFRYQCAALEMKNYTPESNLIASCITIELAINSITSNPIHL